MSSQGEVCVCMGPGAHWDLVFIIGFETVGTGCQWGMRTVGFPLQVTLNNVLGRIGKSLQIIEGDYSFHKEN